MLLFRLSFYSHAISIDLSSVGRQLDPAGLIEMSVGLRATQLPDIVHNQKIPEGPLTLWNSVA